MKTELEETTQVEKQETPESDAPANVLFGTIGYNDTTAYESFIQTMNLNQAVFVLIASANFAQAKGSFNLLESEVLSTAIRTIRKNSASETAPESEKPE